jgi:hypothetical protein
VEQDFAIHPVILLPLTDIELFTSEIEQDSGSQVPEFSLIE